MSVIDERTFGDVQSFREQFAYLNNHAVFNTLKARLQPLCHRTLRRQVLPYARYTKRLPIVQPFSPEEGEDRPYHLVSDYLRREQLITEIEGKLQQRVSQTTLFSTRWRLA